MREKKEYYYEELAKLAEKVLNDQEMSYEEKIKLLQVIV